jgi:aminoglycoside 6'-N-acetyltransferase
MGAAQYRELSFQPLREDDLPRLYSWLLEPHVREFYHRKSVSSWEETRKHYLPRLNSGSPTKCFLTCVNKPIGYIQTYRVADYPEYAGVIGEAEGISLDLFIGDAAYLGIGWGRLILPKFLHEVAFPLFPREEVCWICHEKLNRRALRASKAAGFRYVRDFFEGGDPKELLALHKDEAAARVNELATHENKFLA